MTRLLAVVVLVACSGRPGPRSTTTTHPDDRPAEGSGSAVALTELRSDEQCDRLVAHAVALGAAERPADQKPTDAERTTIQAQLREAWSPTCKQMTSQGYDCAIAARSLAELEACGG